MHTEDVFTRGFEKSNVSRGVVVRVNLSLEASSSWRDEASLKSLACAGVVLDSFFATAAAVSSDVCCISSGGVIGAAEGDIIDE